MKREGINHTKIKRLCRRLDIPLYQAVGILETLWALVARQAPRGDIGRITDEDIALAIDFRGDESKLVEALVCAGWLDVDLQHRLVIHDWWDHADDAVHMKLARAREFFACGKAPKLSRLGSLERPAIAQYYDSCALVCAQNANSLRQPEPRLSPAPPEPLPEPEPFTGPQQIKIPLTQVDRHISPKTWDRFVSDYERTGKPLNEVDWRKAATEAISQNISDDDMIEHVLPALSMELSDMASRQDLSMIPFPANWLKGKSWTRKAKNRDPALVKVPPAEKRRADIRAAAIQQQERRFK